MLDIKRLEEGNFIELSCALQKEDNGLWKIVEAETLNDGDEDFYRVKLDQNESVTGDEIFAEYYPSMAKKLCMFRLFDSFPEENADSWPPPPSITIDKTEYLTLDTEVVGDSHEGFEGTREDGKEYNHWEYEDEKGQKLLQVTLVDGYVSMYIGYVINTGFVNLI